MQICRIWVTALWEKYPASRGAAGVRVGGCSRWVGGISGGGAAQVVLGRREPGAGDGRTWSYAPVEVPAKPQSARPSPINPPSFRQLYCPSVFYPWRWCIYYILRLGWAALIVKSLLRLSACYLQNSSLHSFYKYYMRLHKTL